MRAPPWPRPSRRLDRLGPSTSTSTSTSSERLDGLDGLGRLDRPATLPPHNHKDKDKAKAKAYPAYKDGQPAVTPATTEVAMAEAAEAAP